MKAGQPTKYSITIKNQTYQLCLLGFTIKQIAEFFGVNEDTVYEWKNKHKEYSEILNRGRSLADAKVAASLYKRALGYDYSEETFERVDSKGNLESISKDLIMQGAYRKRIVTKHLPPDVGAITLWLKCRQRELWRDRDWWESLTPEQQDEVLLRMMKLKEKL